MNEAYYAGAKELETDLVGFMQDIIRISSLSSKEGDVIERIRKEMLKLGYDEVKVDPMGNLLGRIGSGPRVIALDGHVDTVDIGDLSLWDRDPLSGDIEDGILYGRGASDMKGGVASSVYAGGLIKQRGIPDDVTVYVTATVQEEDCDGLCWQYIINEGGLRPELVVITEPTSLRIYRGHRGRMEMEVHTSGISCHGSAPERGDNAIYKMANIIADIEDLNARLEPRDPLSKGTVTISEIRSTSPSLCAVADGCTIHLDRRLTIGETEDTSVAEILALPSVKAAGATVTVLDYAVPSYTDLIYPTRKYYPTWAMPEDGPEVKTATAAYRDAFGEEPEVGFWTFSTNAVATAGMHHIPTIGFGPGHEHFAHAPNEQTEIEHLVRSTAFYAALVDTFADGSPGQGGTGT
ncbi:MAG: YgeY family selenium metabolism-linked hydrolase [Gammaproteobacteria bacterium]|nr:YgeY family selenium metabolism-linked hydrolase [Gammaproteobacteria bacterium]MDH3374424.1 YgeY family selenium metabolism-linked hydrolase [Gammaproteobacteria bacterium]MDH3409066.1 YgeY family selenium metabolism-linked hydrolase [Gammaproteobacteria bacterium]MDH3553222.1 YgeY family selenium metabolism-linked hydrolase [Gammaproteobacteria bacterium]